MYHSFFEKRGKQTECAGEIKRQAEVPEFRDTYLNLMDVKIEPGKISHDTSIHIADPVKGWGRSSGFFALVPE